MNKIKWYPVVLKTIEGNKWGYIDKTGRFVVRPVFQEANDFQENGLAIVKIDNKYGVINDKFAFVVRPKYETVMPFSEGLAAVIDESGYRVIDESGKVLTNKSYSYIGKYIDSRAVAAGFTKDGKYLYGYLNEKGEEIIPLQFEFAQDFHNRKAVVQVKEKLHALIDKDGRILQTFPYETVGPLREGKMAFQKEMNASFGYIDERGEIVIKPQFRTAEPFQDGRAVVSIERDRWNRYGLIDEKGNIIIPLQYDDARLLDSGRVALGKARNEQIPYFTSVYAIAETNGKLLTDFRYYGVMNYERGYASSYDEEKTFFIDVHGKVASHLPIVSGSGTMTFIGDLIKAFVDDRLFYFRKDGTLIWQPNTIIPLSGEYRISEKKFRPNKDYVVYVPQICGMQDKNKERKVNEELKKLSQIKDIPSNEMLDYSYTGDFSVEFFQKHLLVLELTGYYYPFGAAHGMPSRSYPHIDLVTGQFYTLADLFKKDRDYVKRLSEIIQKQIDSGESEFASYLFPDAYKGIKRNQPFYVHENELAIYFEPYEIAPYAAGFPTFYIPFAEIMDIIDTDGPFWRSFH